jgi:glucose-6-phosphate isomerase/transaldolase/glucose-6-phosphate isomerase
VIIRPFSLSEEEKRRTFERLWAKDASLWSQDQEEQAQILNRLGWLELPERMTDRLQELKEFGAEMASAGFDHAVVLGMGGSSLFPLVLSEVFEEAEGHPKLRVLDSTDPVEVAKIEGLGLSKTLFIVASKSGTTTEVQAFFNYFWQLAEDGLEDPGSHFIAITDPGTPLEDLARQKGFRRCFLNFEDVGGRYSAISYFGLVPAAIMGLDLDLILERAKKAQKDCGKDVPLKENPGYLLGEFMGEYAGQSRDKLSLLLDSAIKPFGLWLEQLIAESSGKDTLGIVPVFGESTGIPGFYGGERIFTYLRLKETSEEESLDGFIKELIEAEFPVHQILLDDEYDLFYQCFVWELAVALACHFIGVNPFNEPDVKLAKTKTRLVLEHYQKEGKMPVNFWVDPQSQITFRPSSLLAASMKGLARTLRDMFNVLPTWGYLGFLPYLPYDPEVEEVIGEMRHLVRQERGCATVMGYGPRYLHSTGQIHKGGPLSSGFIIFTRKRDRDFPEVPGFGISFWHIEFAQAVGDFEALNDSRKRVIHVHLPANYILGLRSFSKILARAARL